MVQGWQRVHSGPSLASGTSVFKEAKGYLVVQTYCGGGQIDRQTDGQTDRQTQLGEDIGDCIEFTGAEEIKEVSFLVH